MDVNDLRFTGILGAPHLGQQVLGGDDVAGLERKCMQQVELARRQINRVAANGDHVRGWVNHDIARPYNRR
jgi:hypothetical protein